MSTWSPHGAGDFEVLSYESGTEQPPRPRTQPVWAVAAVGLVVGLLVGTLAHHALGRGSSQPSAEGAPVTAGAVDRVPDAFSSDRFELPVFNPGGQELELSVAGLPGSPTAVASTTRTGVAPGSWGMLRFSVPTDCARFVPGSTLPAVELRLATPTGVEETTVPLPEEGTALTTYQEAVCGSPPTIRPDQLHGMWLLDRVYGRGTRLEGIVVLRFAADGAFAADPKGVPFGERQRVRGSYRLHDDLVRIGATRGYGCLPGSHATWRVSAGADDTLVLVWRNGSRGRGPDDVWIARRVLRDVGVPPVQLRRSRISAIP